jgi:hypothetical protein
MPINPDAPIYPETDTSLLQNGAEPILTTPAPPYSSPDYQVPNDQVQPEVDIALLPGVPGQRGPKGDKGDKGDTGPAPTIAYSHSQSAVSSTWSITHNLGFRPNVTTLDSAGSTIEGNVAHVSANQLTVTFSVGLTGNAYLS